MTVGLAAPTVVINLCNEKPIAARLTGSNRAHRGHTFHSNWFLSLTRRSSLLHISRIKHEEYL
ncbi:hypothetical protein J6590_052256 [Homalodisca vitripennis]|nr:hypothetical protein J6590_052256 [Homalodisca vitripennis]